jgi:hypothetical protein
MNPFNLQPLQYVSETLKEGTDYVVVKDGNGFEFKIVNLNNPDYCQRQGIIELEAMRRDNRHKNHRVIRKFTDRSRKLGGLIWGVPMSIDPASKELVWKSFTIEDRLTLDLSIPDQAIMWAVIKNSPFVEGSPNQYGKYLYKVIDKEKRAQTSLEKRAIKRKCEDIIESLKGSALIEMAYNIGVNVQANQNILMLTEQVYSVMEADPKKFYDIYTDPKREYVSIFNKALAKGIINHNVQTGDFMYGGIVLGSQKEIAIKYLIDNTGMAASINAKCDLLDKESLESMTRRISVKDTQDEEDYLKQRLAEIESKKKGVKEEVKESVIETVNFNPPFAGTEEESKTISDEEVLKSLRERAKELKIPGYNLPTMDIAKLSKKIQEAEEKLEA